MTTTSANRMDVDVAQRRAAALLVLAGSLATALLFVLSEFVTIQRPVLVAVVPMAVVALVGAAGVLWWPSE